MTNLAVVISDLHCGSSVGLLPPGLHTADGTEIRQNAVQAWLWQSWQAAWTWAEQVIGDDPHTVIVNGDLVEGIHHGSVQVISGDIGDHIAAAVEALKPLADKATTVHLTVGTECHTRNAEHGIGKAIGASVCPATRRHVHDRLAIDFNGLRLSASHHTSATSRQWLESGEYSRAMAQERLACLRSGWSVPDIYLRAHRHVSGYFTDFSSMMVVTGAWKLADRHTFKAVPGAICEPSIVILDARDCEPGELPRVRFRKFSPPEPAIAA